MTPQSILAKSVLSDAANWFFSIRRRTWLIIAAVAMAALTLALWAAIAISGWLFGIARDGISAAPDAVRVTTEQVVEIFPGAGPAIEQLIKQVTEQLPEQWRAVVNMSPAAPPVQDVSGTDPPATTRSP